MKPRHLLWTCVALLAAIVFCIFVVDRPLAQWLHAHAGSIGLAGRTLTAGFEWMFAFRISSYFVLYLLLALAVGLHLYDRHLRRALRLYYIAASAYATRMLVGFMKEIFERVRPYEYLAGQHGELDFFVPGAHSFPSGHSAWYFGVLLPAAFVLPRWRWPLMGLATLGALARVLEGQHYLGDILASALVALCVALVLMQLMRVSAFAPVRRA